MPPAYRPGSGAAPRRRRRDAPGTARARADAKSAAGARLANVGGRKHCRRSRMFVKVCGLSTPESVRAAAGAGADAVGFVLTRSPREVTPAQAREPPRPRPGRAPRRGRLPARSRRRTPSPLAREAGPGLGPAPRRPHHRRTCGPCTTPGSNSSGPSPCPPRPEAFADWGEDLLLIDAAVPGSGEAWDYGSVRAKGLAGRKWLLAGGLDPANVAGPRRRPGRGAWTSPPASSPPAASRTWPKSGTSWRRPSPWLHRLNRQA